MTNLSLPKLLTIDNTGMPQAPDIYQIQDKDVMALWARDTSHDKRRYISEVGVIYYLGDPKSPAKQKGLSDAESLKEAINNYNLPKDFTIDTLMNRLIKKYYASCITEAGHALEVLQKSIHLSAIAATKVNDHLNNRLSGAIADEDINPILTLIDAVSKRVVEIPNLTKALGVAYENLRDETEQEKARGGSDVTSSMDADDDD